MAKARVKKEAGAIGVLSTPAKEPSPFDEVKLALSALSAELKTHTAAMNELATRLGLVGNRVESIPLKELEARIKNDLNQFSRDVVQVVATQVRATRRRK